MSLKSSPADCGPTGRVRFPKKPANAEATRSVASSLSVSGNRSNSSNSGSSGQLDAAHSARTILWIPSRIVVRVA